MQGKKDYQEKLYTSFQLSHRIPEDNFYRRLKSALQFDFVYLETEKFYGNKGQKSIDPKVFFKMMLVQYLENIDSDRKLVDHCSMRLDILFFLGYDIDEELPWHSTISRTRQLFPEELFEKIFNKIFEMCVEKGMVSGHTQAVDSAFVKANASMESLELKVPEESLEEYLHKYRYMSSPDRKAKINRAEEKQQIVSADKKKLQDIKSRQEKWSKDQDQKPGGSNNNAKYTSNHTHYSPTDPDARISVKPGKSRKLNYLSQMGVDSENHVITHIQSFHADKKDNQYLQEIVSQIEKRLIENGLHLTTILADAGYSSGENYAWFEEKGLDAFIPPHGTYKGGPKGFVYNKTGNFWTCPNGIKVTFRKTKIEKGGIKKDVYFTTRKDCKNCPIKAQCIGKSHEKRIDITHYREQYERAIEKLKNQGPNKIKKKRQGIVEPVFGSLINFYGMRKVYTRGIQQSNKIMIMAAAAYNLKKYMKFQPKNTISVANTMKMAAPLFFNQIIAFLRLLDQSKYFQNFAERKILHLSKST